jgi:hypothetical protein
MLQMTDRQTSKIVFNDGFEATAKDWTDGRNPKDATAPSAAISYIPVIHSDLRRPACLSSSGDKVENTIDRW